MKLLSFGEILWDVYPDAKYLGGASLNFGAHVAKQGGEAYMLSALGNDGLGAEALAVTQEWGLNVKYVSLSNEHQTGACVVTLDEKGIPSYDLLDNVAYDFIESPKVFEEKFNAFYFGTLALRHEHNRAQIEKIIKNNTFNEIFVDINIRKPYATGEAMKLAFNTATIIKISDEELPFVQDVLFGTSYETIEAAKEIAKAFKNLRIIIITLGSEGSVAYDCKKDVLYSIKAQKVKVASTVGAGDSFSATFLNKFLSGNSIEDCLKSATKVSAFVVSKTDAVPEYENLEY
ncbi:MAG: hypothetical protein IKB86_00170 [Clostridia bacterium]|nr:hypothetical protein [Clostridia bacterium]